MKTVKSKKEMAAALKVGLARAENDFSEMFRKTALEVYRHLVILTPEDTGWAMQHWSVGLNRTVESVPVIFDKLEGVKPGDVVNIFNNVPYIGVLDEGHSTQKPHGFTHIALASAEVKAAQESKKLSAKVYKDV